MMSKEELLQAINNKMRDMTTEAVMFHQAVADFLGLYITDHKCLDYIYRFGPMTAGRLAQVSGLTTGAVTGVIDRLEAAGYVQRAKDPTDRRKIVIEIVQNKKLERKLMSIFGPLEQKMNQLLSAYSESQLEFLLEVLDKTLNESNMERVSLMSSRRSPAKKG